MLTAQARGNALGSLQFRDYSIQEDAARACVLANYKENHEKQV